METPPQSSSDLWFQSVIAAPPVPSAASPVEPIPFVPALLLHRLPPAFTADAPHRNVDEPDSLFSTSSKEFARAIDTGKVSKLLRTEDPGVSESWGIYRAEDCANDETRLTLQRFAVQSTGRLWLDLCLPPRVPSRAQESGEQPKEERSDTASGFGELSKEDDALLPTLRFHRSADPHLRQLFASLASLFPQVPSHNLEIGDLVAKSRSVVHELRFLAAPFVGPTRKASALHFLEALVPGGSTSMMLEKLHAHADLAAGESTVLAVDDPVIVVGRVDVAFRGRMPGSAAWGVDVYDDFDELLRSAGARD